MKVFHFSLDNKTGRKTAYTWWALTISITHRYIVVRPYTTSRPSRAVNYFVSWFSDFKLSPAIPRERCLQTPTAGGRYVGLRFGSLNTTKPKTNEQTKLIVEDHILREDVSHIANWPSIRFHVFAKRPSTHVYLKTPQQWIRLWPTHSRPLRCGMTTHKPNSQTFSTHRAAQKVIESPLLGF